MSACCFDDAQARPCSVVRVRQECDKSATRVRQEQARRKTPLTPRQRPASQSIWTERSRGFRRSVSEGRSPKVGVAGPEADPAQYDLMLPTSPQQATGRAGCRRDSLGAPNVDTWVALRTRPGECASILDRARQGAPLPHAARLSPVLLDHRENDRRHQGFAGRLDRFNAHVRLWVVG